MNGTKAVVAAGKSYRLPLTALYILWGLGLVWGLIYANNTIYAAILAQPPHMDPYWNDLVSDAVLLFAALFPAVLLPGFFGYSLGEITRYWKMLLGMAAFFVVAPLLYRALMGATPFGANTWFFEGIVVPVAEEGCFRGLLLSVLLWGFGKLYSARTAGALALVLSTLIFASAHLNNLGHYPAGFILFQVGFSTVLGLAFGYTRLKAGSLYPAILLHALFNLAGTL
jgi:membrane protease YdiL (CAAX protease family)